MQLNPRFQPAEDSSYHHEHVEPGNAAQQIMATFDAKVSMAKASEAAKAGNFAEANLMLLLAGLDAVHSCLLKPKAK